MYNQSKLQIYQGIIQYLLDTTDYSLKTIAALTNSSIKNIRSIYSYNEIPSGFDSSEKQLVQLYQIVLELHAKQRLRPVNFAKEAKTYENLQY